MLKETTNLGAGDFLTEVTPSLDDIQNGWYNSGRRAHSESGRPSMLDFLPRNMVGKQHDNEALEMATIPSVKPVGANLGTPPNAKTGPNNLNKANQTGATAPKSGGSLK